ncbi:MULTISPECIES: cytochrome c [unclassified Thioalkalivibrio]|uniref:c-type cytochrome n=1 Tax=unclassified Thioalkalivibrio TaxID=2621013 RepID=UPI00035FE2D0|nr:MULTISPECIES: cytochrome c [unclassified Thioalkalivibrio]
MVRALAGRPHPALDRKGAGRGAFIITRSTLATVVVGLSLVLAGCGDEASDAAQQERAPYPIQGINIELVGDPQVGRERFAQSCAECHGADARGTEQGPALIHRIYEPSHHADVTFFIAVERGVIAHHWEYGDMPPVPGLDHQDVADIVAWVRHEQRDDGIIPDDEWPVNEE